MGSWEEEATFFIGMYESRLENGKEEELLTRRQHWHENKKTKIGYEKMWAANQKQVSFCQSEVLE